MKIYLIKLSGKKSVINIGSNEKLSDLQEACSKKLNTSKKDIALLCEDEYEDIESLKHVGLADGDYIVVKNNEDYKTTGFVNSHRLDQGENDKSVKMNSNNTKMIVLMKKHWSSSGDQIRYLLKPYSKRDRSYSVNHSKHWKRAITDYEVLEKMAEKSRMKIVNENLTTALASMPECFNSPSMLFVRGKLNDYPVIAFIDTGAQNSLVSEKCAHKSGILKLLDSKWRGTAKGIGVQRVIGRVHLVELELGDASLSASVAVLQGERMPVIIGLDVLKTYKCTIDLEHHVLNIGVTNTKVSFVSEDNLPKYFRKSKVRCVNCCKIKSAGMRSGCDEHRVRDID